VLDCGEGLGNLGRHTNETAASSERTPDQSPDHLFTKPKIMSETEETDRQSFVAQTNEGKEHCVEVWFAEKLERERDKALLKLREQRDAYEALLVRFNKLQTNTDREI
jgi:hypothetical protein